MSHKKLSIDAQPSSVNITNLEEREQSVGSQNRAHDVRMESNEKTIKISLEFINEVILEYFSKVVSPTITEMMS